MTRKFMFGWTCYFTMPQQTFSDQASYADNTAQEILFIV